MLLWPYLLLQTRLLRDMAAYSKTTKLHQSQLYLLEHCIEEALNETNADVGRVCINWLNTPFPINDDYYFQYLNEIAKQYVLGPQGKARIKKLPKLLNMLYPYSDEYMEFAGHIESEATKHDCSPHQLSDDSEWPDFKW